MHDLHTPVVLSVSAAVGYLVSGLLATVTLELAASLALVVTYSLLALLVSWLLLHYGNGSDDVISAIDAIAHFIMAKVS